MGWETRGKYRYFVVSKRRGGRVVHLTFKGPAAHVAAWEAASRREHRRQAIAARQAYRSLWADARAPLGELVRLTKLLQEAILLTAGYHQHAREWRRRIRPMSAQSPLAPATAPAQADPSGDLWQRLGELADRAQKGDAAALPEIRHLLDEHPDVWKTAGDWAVHAREAWVKLASHGDAVMAESTRRRLDALQEELSRPFQDRLERLLVERLVICNFQLQLADAELAEVEKQPAAKRADVVKCHAAAQLAFERAQKALGRHRQLTKAVVPPVVAASEWHDQTFGSRSAGRGALSPGTRGRSIRNGSRWRGGRVISAR